MKTPFRVVLSRYAAALTIAAFSFAGISCMTTYDAYGRPVQSVDPGAAVAGAAAAGILGYAIANNGNNHHHYRGDRGYYRPYRGGYSGRYRRY